MSYEDQSQPSEDIIITEAELKQSEQENHRVNPGPLDKLKAFLVSRRIEVTSLPSQPDNIDDLVTIIDSSKEAEELEIIISEESEPQEPPPHEIEIGIEPAMRLAVSTQKNQESAQAFYKELRISTPRLLEDSEGSHYPDYTNKEWYHWYDLVQLADRWQIPLFIIAKNGNHWVLALKAPEKDQQGNYHVLVYDPMKGGEEWLELPNWETAATQINLGNVAFMNTLALQEYKAGTYNLSLFGDEELATRNLDQAKNTRIQLEYDGENCGPACLFMAALRAGVQIGWNGFKFSGRDQLKDDTGLTVLTREEILEQI